MTRSAQVTKTQIARAVAGLKAQGESIGGVKIMPGGEVHILTGKPQAALTPAERARVRMAEVAEIAERAPHKA